MNELVIGIGMDVMMGNEKIKVDIWNDIWNDISKKHYTVQVQSQSQKQKWMSSVIKLV